MCLFFAHYFRRYEVCVSVKVIQRVEVLSGRLKRSGTDLPHLPEIEGSSKYRLTQLTLLMLQPLFQVIKDDQIHLPFISKVHRQATKATKKWWNTKNTNRKDLKDPHLFHLPASWRRHQHLADQCWFSRHCDAISGVKVRLKFGQSPRLRNFKRCSSTRSTFQLSFVRSRRPTLQKFSAETKFLSSSPCGKSAKVCL